VLGWRAATLGIGLAAGWQGQGLSLFNLRPRKTAVLNHGAHSQLISRGSLGLKLAVSEAALRGGLFETPTAWSQKLRETAAAP